MLHADWPSTNQVVDSRNYTFATLEEDIDSVLNWGQHNQVKFNPDKSQIIFFSNRNYTDAENFTKYGYSCFILIFPHGY